jgi:hypothetical protein
MSEITSYFLTVVILAAIGFFLGGYLMALNPIFGIAALFFIGFFVGPIIERTLTSRK